MLVGSHIVNNSHVKRFLKNSANLKPPKPKHESTWDPSVVLSYLKLPENKDCDSKTLTFKLVSLLALITAQREQTLHLIDIRHFKEIGDRIEIKIPEEVKTSGPGKKQPVSILPRYSIDAKICVVLVLKCYLRKTAELRGNAIQLFISFEKHHNLVSGQSLSR